MRHGDRGDGADLREKQGLKLGYEQDDTEA